MPSPPRPVFAAILGLAAAWGAFAWGEEPAANPAAKRYDEISWLCTHNAYASTADGWLVANQTHDLSRQFADGVRALMLDVHRVDGQPCLVHGTSLLGKKRLVAGLKEIAGFLDKNPREVVTIIFENYVTADELADAFRAADLLKHAHEQPRDKPWPTLDKMIADNRRLVVFTDREGGKLPWLHATWDYCWETPFTATDERDFSFRPLRGKREHSLFLLNHFLTAPLPSASLAAKANRAECLRERMRRCVAECRRPSFVAVDFYELGVVRDVVAELNRGEFDKREPASKP